MATMTRGEFVNQYQDDKIDTLKLRRDRNLSTTAADKTARADTNGDGVISGRREVSKLFTAVDHFDRNGDWHSVSTHDTRNTANISTILSSISRASDAADEPETSSSMLGRFLTQHPEMQTHQDMINYCLKAGGGDWGRGQSFANHFGLDLNQLVKTRSASLRRVSGAASTTNTNSATHTATPARATTSDAPAARVPTGIYGNVFRRHTQHLRSMRATPESVSAYGLNAFKTTWQTNQARYERVAQATNIPAPLIAAIHFRESSSNFKTYLHQGDPLGRPAVHHPRNIPVFHQWEEAAIHALGTKSWLRDQLHMKANTQDPVSIATFAEAYNGLGYHNRGLTSPYVYAGTNVYQGGRYVADGVFDPSSWDQRPGVMALVALTESAA